MGKDQTILPSTIEVDPEIAIQIARVEAERQKAKSLAERLGLSRFLQNQAERIRAGLPDSGTRSIMVLLDQDISPQNGNMRIIIETGRTGGFIDNHPSPDNLVYIRSRAKLCTGKYFENLQIQRKTGNDFETIGGAMMIIGRERGGDHDPNLWAVSLSCYQGPCLSDNGMLDNKYLRFDPGDMDFHLQKLLTQPKV